MVEEVKMRNIFTFFLLSFFAIAPRVQAASAPEKAGKAILPRVRVSQSAVNTRSAILWIADGQGLFAKHGIAVETIYLRSSNLQMAALVNNGVQISNTGGAPVLHTGHRVDGNGDGVAPLVPNPRCAAR